MPNWCMNTVRITHPHDKEIVRDLATAASRGDIFQMIKPTPFALRVTTAGSFADEDKQQHNQALEADNQERFGYKNWWDYQVSEWGTKWEPSIGSVEVTEDGDSATLYLYFDSAWSPPLGIYEELQKCGFDVDASYYEPGMDFAGVWINGEDAYVEEISSNDYNDDEFWEGDLIKRIDEDFNVREFLNPDLEEGVC